MSGPNYEKRIEHITSTIDSVSSWINIINDEIEDVDEKGKLFLELKQTVKACAKCDILNEETINAIKKTTKYFDNLDNDQSISIEDYYSKMLGESGVVKDDDIDSHRFLTSISKIMDNDEKICNDEIVATQNFVPPKDPFTKLFIVKPVKNNRCGHVYEQSTVNKFSKCPYIGCKNTNTIIAKDLVLDTGLQNKIDNYNRTHCNGNNN